MFATRSHAWLIYNHSMLFIFQCEILLSKKKNYQSKANHCYCRYIFRSQQNNDYNSDNSNDYIYDYNNDYNKDYKYDHNKDYNNEYRNIYSNNYNNNNTNDYNNDLINY